MLPGKVELFHSSIVMRGVPAMKDARQISFKCRQGLVQQFDQGTVICVLLGLPEEVSDSPPGCSNRFGLTDPTQQFLDPSGLSGVESTIDQLLGMLLAEGHPAQLSSPEYRPSGDPGHRSLLGFEFPDRVHGFGERWAIWNRTTVTSAKTKLISTAEKSAGEMSHTTSQILSE